MTYFAFLALVAGIMLEMGYLFYTRRSSGVLVRWLAKGFRYIKPFLPAVAVFALFGLVLAAIVIAGTGGLKEALFVKQYTMRAFFIKIVAQPLALFVFFNAMFNARLLPVVNEQGVLMMLLLFWYNIIARGIPTLAPPVLYASLGMSALTLLSILPHWKLKLLPKSLLYLTYLGMLCYTTVINFPMGTFETADFTADTLFILGAAGVYVVFFASFFVRFFIIVLSFWWKRNRDFARPMIEEMFTDYQLPLREAALHITVLAGILLLNFFLKIVDSYMLTLAILLLAFQYFSHRIRKQQAITGRGAGKSTGE